MRDKDFPSTPDEVAAFMDRLNFSDESVPAHKAPPPLAPGDDIMVTSSIRMPLELHTRVKQLADTRGIGMSTLIREWMEVAIAELDGDQLISRADAVRALSRLHPIHRAS
jgi:predicted DNA-binding protein